MTTAGAKFNKKRNWRKAPSKDVVNFDSKEEEAVPAKVLVQRFKCRECGHVMFYKARECPNCNKTNMIEEMTG